MGGHWFARPPYRCEPVTQVPIQDSVTMLGSSLTNIVLKDDRDVVFYFPLHPKFVILIVSEGVCTT